MIYLDNTQNTQEVWIPRNDGDGNIYVPHTYQEGYEDGIEHQKSLLSSATFTENGEYERSDGWSAVTVEVEPALEEVNVVISADTTTITPSSGYYGISEATIDASGYAQENYDSGFDDGYTDGYSSGASEGYDSGYTEGYQSGYTSGYTDGYDSGYTSGNTDGFNSGYTSGETHQKSLLGTTAFTINGSYSAENGYSAITVNVPTGQTYNIEQNKPFTATSNGNYTITPTSASTNVTDRFDSDRGRYYLTATTSGYPSNGYFELFLIEDEFDSSKGSIEVYFANGDLDYDDSDWYGGEVDWDSYDNNELELVVYDANNGFGYTMLSDFNYSYDVMSAVSLNVNIDTASTYQSGYTSGHTDGVSEEKAKLSAATFTANTAITLSDGGYSAITVNVPQSGSTEKDIVICTSGGCWFNTNYQIEYGDSFEIEHCTFGENGAIEYSHQQYMGGGSGEYLRIGQAEGTPNKIYMTYCNNINVFTAYTPTSGSYFSDNTVLFSSSALTIDGTVVKTYSTTSNSNKGTLIFFANTASGGDIVKNQTAKMGRVKVYASDGTLKATFEPRLDEFNVPYFKYIEQDIDIYASGNTAPFYEEIFIDPTYQSGYTDGQNSIISTFTAMTATTNGIYGSSASPLSSITVDVPQSGGGGTVVITPVDYIHKSTLSNASYSDLIGTGIIPTDSTIIRIKGLGKGINNGDTIVGYDSSNESYPSYRGFWTGNRIYNDIQDQRINHSWNGYANNTPIDITFSNHSIYDNMTNTMLVSGSPKTITTFKEIKFDVNTWWLKSLQIWNGQTLVFDGQAAYDDSGNIGLFDNVSKTLVYNSGVTMAYEIEGVSFSSITITANTAITTSSGGYSAITVNVPQSSGVYGTKTITLNGTYSASTDSLDGYSAVTVNVPQSGVQIPILFADYIHTDPISGRTNIYIDTGIFPTTATTIRFKYKGKGLESSAKYVGFSFGSEEDVYKTASDNSDYRLLAQWNSGKLGFDVGTTRLQSDYVVNTNDVDYDLTLGNYYVYDNINETMIVTGATKTGDGGITPNIPIMVNVSCIWLKSLEIWEGQTKVFDGEAAYKANGDCGLYNSIGGEFLTPTNTGVSMTYEIEGISLSSITITANTAITLSQGGYSAITVNVPQIQSSATLGELYCLYCENDCKFGFTYSINGELASIDDIHFSALPLSDFSIEYEGDLDGNNYKIGKMEWTDEGDGYYHFSGTWETTNYTYNTNDSTSRAIKDFPNMHSFDWKIYATKTYSVDSDDLTISNGGGAPSHTSTLSISGNSYYLGNVSVDNQYCLWYVAVDDDGNGCLKMGNNYKYPSQGNCYPVYRKLINGDYVYRVVKPISVGGV